MTLRGVSLWVEMSAAMPFVLFFLQNFHKVLAQRESRGHVERRHMANPLCYTSGMDLHLLEEGGVSYTKVPLAFT